MYLYIAGAIGLLLHRQLVITGRQPLQTEAVPGAHQWPSISEIITTPLLDLGGACSCPTTPPLRDGSSSLGTTGPTRWVGLEILSYTTLHVHGEALSQPLLPAVRCGVVF